MTFVSALGPMTVQPVASVETDISVRPSNVSNPRVMIEAGKLTRPRLLLRLVVGWMRSDESTREARTLEERGEVNLSSWNGLHRTTTESQPTRRRRGETASWRMPTSAVRPWIREICAVVFAFSRFGEEKMCRQSARRRGFPKFTLHPGFYTAQTNKLGTNRRGAAGSGLGGN